jgi:hypothetical protein
VATGRARRGVTGGLLTGAQATARRRHTTDEASAPSGHGAGTIEEGRRRGEVVRCSTGVRVPFYMVGRGAGRPGMMVYFGNWHLHGCCYQSEGGGAVAAPWRGRRRRRCRLIEGGRKGNGGMAWWAGSAYLAARGQKDRMGWLATGPIGSKVEGNSFSNKKLNF